MNMKFLATTATAVLLLAAPATAATLFIDNFTFSQTVGDGPTASTPSTIDRTSNTSGFIASKTGETTRTLLVKNTAFTGNEELATTLQSGGNQLSFNNNTGATGKATLTYTGLLDLEANLSTGSFFFDILEFDQESNADFRFDAVDNEGIEVFFTETLNSFSPTLLFTELFGNKEAFDFRNVASLSFSIDSSNSTRSLDGALRSVSVSGDVSAVPVPAAGLLLLGAMGGLAGLRRRKAKKAA